MNKEEVLIGAEATPRVEITKTNPSVLMCVYGTLRRGNGNYRALLEGKAEYLGTFQSEAKYTMLGRRAGFPRLLTKGDTAITYEVFKVTSPAVLERMHGLEGCSGIPGNPENWYDICPITTPLGDAWIYAMHGEPPNNDSIIPTGDWNDRNK